MIVVSASVASHGADTIATKQQTLDALRCGIEMRSEVAHSRALTTQESGVRLQRLAVRLATDAAPVAATLAAPAAPMIHDEEVKPASLVETPTPRNAPTPAVSQSQPQSQSSAATAPAPFQENPLRARSIDAAAPSRDAQPSNPLRQ